MVSSRTLETEFSEEPGKIIPFPVQRTGRTLWRNPRKKMHFSQKKNHREKLLL